MSVVGIGREERCYVECGCGHRSYGDTFGGSNGNPINVWHQHRLHMDVECPNPRIPRADPRRLRLEEAVGEIREILDRVGL